MNLEIKAAWVAALRSGAFVQGRNFLCTADADGLKHCCLGVLCELHAQAHPGHAVLPVHTPRLEYDEALQLQAHPGHAVLPVHADNDTCYLGHNCTLPAQVTAWAGLSLCDPTVVYNDTAATLSSLNDGLKLGTRIQRALPFSKIAHLIQASLAHRLFITERTV